MSDQSQNTTKTSPVSSSNGKSDENVLENRKRSLSDDQSEVHSANSWENADLGDDERKSKFLRLMGASKKEHQGRFVIGESNKVHTDRAEEDEQTEKVATELEHQFKDSMEHKVSGAARRHVGLGFSDDDPCPKDTHTPQSEHQTSSEGNDKPDAEEQASEKTETSDDTDDTTTSKPQKGIYAMFVKSSDDGK